MPLLTVPPHPSSPGRNMQEQRAKRIVNVVGSKKKAVLETLGVVKQTKAAKVSRKRKSVDAAMPELEELAGRWCGDGAGRGGDGWVSSTG